MVLVQILEQPAKEIRFRYKSERRQKSDDDDDETNRTTTAGIPGINSEPPDRKTYPSIIIKGYKGWATIRVSCVVHAHENGKFRPHPHELAGPNCKDGCYEEWLKVTSDEFVKVFDKLSIRCIRKKDVIDSLELRRKKKVDPFETGKLPAKNLNINLGAVRLCFEVFIHGADALEALAPQVSKVILDKKKQNKLKISYCSHTSAPVSGAGNKIVLLCDKIFAKEIDVVFFEMGKSGDVEWETRARSEFIFKHMAVVVKVPPYRDPQSLLDHDVKISLWDLSEETKSTMSYPFKYTGIQTDPAYRPQEEPELVTYSTRYGPILARKRAKKMYWIPPELFKIPTSYNFQETTTGVPSTSAAAESPNLPTRGNAAMVDRFYSVPGENHENKLLNRKSSCPERYMSGNCAAIPSISRQHFDVQLDNAGNIYEQQSYDESHFSQATPYFEAKTEIETIRATTSCSQTSDLKYVPHENMDVCNFNSTNIEEQISVPTTCSLPYLLPNSSTDFPTSSNDAFGDLLSMDELMLHLETVQNNQENLTEDPYPDFLNSPNFPNFKDIIERP